MTREEAIEQLKYAIELIKQDGKDYLDERDIPMLEMAIESLEVLDFAERELKFVVEHSISEERDHYQRALNLIINKENFYRLKENKQSDIKVGIVSNDRTLINCILGLAEKCGGKVIERPSEEMCPSITVNADGCNQEMMKTLFMKELNNE